MGWLLVLLLRVPLARLVRAWEPWGEWAMHKASLQSCNRLAVGWRVQFALFSAQRASGPNCHAVCAAIAGAASFTLRLLQATSWTSLRRGNSICTSDVIPPASPKRCHAGF